MTYLHSTDIGSHGNLSSLTCVIDHRWNCKITDYGLAHFRKLATKTEAQKADDKPFLSRESKIVRKCTLCSFSMVIWTTLFIDSSIASTSMGISIWCDCLMRLDPFWTAPELLRKPRRLRPLNGTKKGDVYSFAIIIQEVLINQIPFGIDLETLTPYGQHLTRLHSTVTTINSVNSTVTSAHNGHNYYNCMNMICGLLLRRSPGVVSASDFRTTPYFYQQQLIWAYVRSPSALFRVW